MLYKFKGRGFIHPYDAPGYHTYRQKLDMEAVLRGDEDYAMVGANDQDVVPPLVEAGDIYRIFQCRAGFMVHYAGFAIVNKNIADFTAGHILFLGVQSGAIVDQPGSTTGADPDFFAAMLPDIGNLAYPALSADLAGYVGGLNGFLFTEDGSIDFEFETLAEEAESEFDEAIFEFFCCGQQVLDADELDSVLTPMTIP